MSLGDLIRIRDFDRFDIFVKLLAGRVGQILNMSMPTEFFYFRTESGTELDLLFKNEGCWKKRWKPLTVEDAKWVK